MATPKGFYFGHHDGCYEYQHHRHPFTVDGQATPQPHEYIVEIRATVTTTLSVDIDGTIRVRDMSFGIDKGYGDRARIEDRETNRSASLEGDLWDQLIAAVPDEGEIAFSPDWPKRPDPILDVPTDSGVYEDDGHIVVRATGNCIDLCPSCLAGMKVVRDA